MNEKLLPCPFCGEPQECGLQLEEDAQGWLVICYSCGANMRTYHTEDCLIPEHETSKNKLIEGWNTRSEPSTPPLYKEVDCRECEDGKIIMGRNLSDTGWCSDNCSNCKGTGKIRKPIYYSPAEYESWMHNHGQPEFKILDTDPVWIEGIESPWFEWDWSAYKEFEKGEQCYMRLVGQPKPLVEEKPKSLHDYDYYRN